jgi:hypothetical protein
MPRQISLQLTEASERQIAFLKEQGFGTTTDIIRIALDRMYQSESKNTEAPRSEIAQLHEEFIHATYEWPETSRIEFPAVERWLNETQNDQQESH